MAADNDYTIPAPINPIGTTGSIGDVDITDQLPTDTDGLHQYPVATKSWVASLEDPTKTRTVFTRDIITTELPGADSVGEDQGGNEWTNAQSTITYTDENYGKEI